MHRRSGVDCVSTDNLDGGGGTWAAPLHQSVAHNQTHPVVGVTLHQIGRAAVSPSSFVESKQTLSQSKKTTVCVGSHSIT